MGLGLGLTLFSKACRRNKFDEPSFFSQQKWWTRRVESWSGPRTTCVRISGIHYCVGPVVHRSEKKKGMPQPSGYTWRPSRVTAAMRVCSTEGASVGSLPDRSVDMSKWI